MLQRTAIKPKPCRWCQSEKHLSWRCYQNPKRAEQTAKKLSNGKVARRWYKTRRQWFKENPAEGYTCYLCGVYVPKNEVTLDHIIPRSRRPDLRYELTNLAPACWTCNSQKGSKVLTNKETV